MSAPYITVKGPDLTTSSQFQRLVQNEQTTTVENPNPSEEITEEPTSDPLTERVTDEQTEPTTGTLATETQEPDIEITTEKTTTEETTTVETTTVETTTKKVTSTTPTTERIKITTNKNFRIQYPLPQIKNTLPNYYGVGT